MTELYERIQAAGIVPVIAIENAADAPQLGRALCEGGLPCAEITFRTAAAEEAIRSLTAALPHMLVGAGTVLTPKQVDRAAAAGAAFIVSPGLNPRVVRHCQQIGIPVIPGCATPGEVEAALELGLQVVKFFPAEAAGGLAMIKAMAAPYPSLRFLPTGGINEANLNDYLAFDRVLACGGSWMAKTALIREGKFDEIRAKTATAVAKMHGFTIKHVGINAADAPAAAALANTLCAAIGGAPRETEAACFAGLDLFEVMKGGGPGEHGHIALGCNNLRRAAAYLQSRGVAVDEATARYDAAGNPTFLYLQPSFGGFRIHLTLNN